MSVAGAAELPADLADAIVALAHKAGRAILEIYATDFAARAKADRSPVTDADEAAERIILAGLARLSPALPVVAEESVARGAVPAVGATPFWLVDPLDGTREFIDRNGEFTVNIALVADRRPVLGVVHLPATGTTYLGAGPAHAFRIDADGSRRAIAARRPAAEGYEVVMSRSHRDAETEAWLRGVKVTSIVHAGSALKFGRLAEGAADLYPRLGPTSEWDTAAGQAVLTAAGGSVRTLDGAGLTYGKPGFRNPGFIARGRD